MGWKYGYSLLGNDGRGPGQNEIPVSIVSNSCLISEGLPVLLSGHLDLRLIGCYPGAPVATAVLPNPHDHVVLVDSGIGQRAATGWTNYWRDQDRPARVLLVELVDDVEVIVECIAAGASGYVLVGASVEEIADAILLLQQGKAQCSPEVAGHLFERVEDMARQMKNGQCPLTQRELEVLACVARGYTNQQIANELVITLRTVKHHVHNILCKLKLRRRGEAAQLAIQRGWVESHRSSFRLS